MPANGKRAQRVDDLGVLTGIVDALQSGRR